MDLDEARRLMGDLESDRVERTASLSNTDKFAQAICAFANDMAHHRQPGYLFLGVKDNGELSGAEITDRNPVLAEAARALGFVNRYGRGIAIAQDELQRNHTLPAQFELGVKSLSGSRSEAAMKTVAFFNNKGGVGKTTLVYHLAWMYQELGVGVVALDLDPQANLTTAFLSEERLEQLWLDSWRMHDPWRDPAACWIGSEISKS